MEGTPFGRYRLVELLGRGGMGEVWRAYDTDTDRIVAIKLLPAFLSDDEEFQERFRREAHAAARLNNPHVIPIHHYGEIDCQLYVDMRLIEGRDLQTVLADGPLDPARAVRIIEQVAKALHAAHQVGLLHRDIKPSNILIDSDDFAYLIDFGISRAIEETRMTKSSNTIGTFQIHRTRASRNRNGRGCSRRHLFARLRALRIPTGHLPFPDGSMARLINAHLNTPPPQPSTTQPNVPVQVDHVIATGMAKDPKQRYATTIELAKAARDAITDPFGMSAPAQPPTQQAPVHHLAMTTGDSSTAPTQFGQAIDPGSTAPPASEKNAKRRRLALAGGAAAVIALVVVLIVVFSNGGTPATKPVGDVKPVAAPNTGPFTGVYRADFGPSATNGTPDEGATPSTGQWSMRSACRPTGCVATANAAGGATLQSTFVVDDFGGQWHAVSAAHATSPPPDVTGFKDCPFPAEYWTVITLQQRPDGTLGGQYRAWSSGDLCETERTVTFTRIGDVDINSLPDPAGQAPRVPSPAEGWHGRYHGTHTPLNKSNSASNWDNTYQTDCLRTGERCVTHSLAGDRLVFADGKWTSTLDMKIGCNSGGSTPTKLYYDVPLPQPPQDPIPLLTGHGHREITGGGCAGSYDEDWKYQRTGD